MQTATDITAENALPARLPKGFELCGYVVDGWLRDGGMAAIYRARRISDDRRVALKLQLPATAHDEAIGERFELEADVMRRAGASAHVVELLDAGVLDDGRHYLFIEWVDGEDLEELLDFLRNQDRRLEIPRACRIGRDIARGLAELHEHGVVHLDLKPANVMVATSGSGEDVIKLVDFGIAADLKKTGADAGGVVGTAPMGTSSYMSPQQRAGEASSPMFDVYALGVLLFEALSGSRLPPDGWSPQTLPRLETLRRGVPQELAALVFGCMDVDPARRPASAGEVATALVHVIRRLEAGGGGRAVSREDVPVRTGATELVPRSSVAAAREAVELPVRTGGTEVSLTHQEVLRSSQMLPTVTPEMVADAMDRLAAKEEAEARAHGRSRLRWLGVGGVVVASLVVGVWAAGDSEPSSVVAAAGSVAVAGGAEGVEGEGDAEPGGAHPVGVEDDRSGSAVVEEAEPGRAQEARREPVDRAGTKAAGDEAAAPGVTASEDADGAGAKAPEDADGAHEVDEAADRSRAGKAKASARPKGPSEEECESQRRDADDAKKARSWRWVLRATATRRCWSSGEHRLARKRLRVEAWAELTEYDACIKEAGRSKDSEIAARVAFCRKALDGGEG